MSRRVGIRQKLFRLKAVSFNLTCNFVVLPACGQPLCWITEPSRPNKMLTRKIHKIQAQRHKDIKLSGQYLISAAFRFFCSLCLVITKQSAKISLAPDPWLLFLRLGPVHGIIGILYQQSQVLSLQILILWRYCSQSSFIMFWFSNSTFSCNTVDLTWLNVNIEYLWSPYSKLSWMKPVNLICPAQRLSSVVLWSETEQNPLQRFVISFILSNYSSQRLGYA